jgi:hypothetical protein
MVAWAVVVAVVSLIAFESRTTTTVVAALAGGLGAVLILGLRMRRLP